MSVLIRLGGIFINVLVVILLRSRTSYIWQEPTASGRHTIFDLPNYVVGSLG